MDVEVTPNVLVVLVAVTEQLPATVTLATAESAASTSESTVTVFKYVFIVAVNPGVVGPLMVVVLLVRAVSVIDTAFSTREKTRLPVTVPSKSLKIPISE